MKLTYKTLFFLVAVSGLLFGYDIGVISGAIHFIDVALKIEQNSLTEGFVVASVLIGASIGALVSNKLSNAIGRRICLAFGSLSFCFGAIISALSPSFEVLICGRVVLGFAIGLVSALTPMYLSELAPQEKRGSLAFLNQLTIVLGILLSYIVNFCFVWFSSELWNAETGWRIALAAAIDLAIILLFASMVLPESPYFLVHKGRIEEATAVLKTLRPASHTDSEIANIKSFLVERSFSIREAFKRYSRPAVLLALFLAVFQQFMGCNTVIYYAPKILETLGFDIFGQRLILVAIGVFNILATIVAIFIVDKFNRKTLFFAGGIAMAFSMALIAFLDYSGKTATLDPIFMVFAALALLLFIISFGVTWGGIMWVVLGEILPAHVRTVGVTVASIANWISNFIVCLFFPVLLGIFASQTHFVFAAIAAICLLGVLFTQVCLFETKHKTSEEIESMVSERARKK